MVSKRLCSCALVVAFCLALVAPAHADTLKSDGDHIIIGIVAVAAALVVVTVLVIHYSTKKREITGCVVSAKDGMSLMNDKDKLSYALSGNTAGVLPGHRMKLQGKRAKHSDANMPVWEVSYMTSDLGACPP